MDEKDLKLDENIDLTAEPAKILAEKQISDFVEVIIDEDFDVTIIDNFMGVTKSVLPKEEAVGVAQFIVEFFENLSEKE
jgi:hypothetical protein